MMPTSEGLTCGIVPRVLVVEKELERNEPYYLTVMSDIHAGSTSCNVKKVQSVLKERSQLANHSVVLIGDTIDSIGGFDDRMRPSHHPRSLQGRDDWLDQSVRYAVEMLSVPGITYDMVGVGNHEDSYLHHHGGDVVSILAYQLKAARGGYTGIVDYRFKVHSGPSRKGATKMRFRLQYHHGRWGGRDNKGYTGAKSFFYQLDDWDVGVFGHNHSMRYDPEVRKRVRRDGTIELYPVRIVNIGSYSDGFSEDGREVRYAEKYGYTYQPVLEMLITIEPVWHGKKANLLTKRVKITI